MDSIQKDILKYITKEVNNQKETFIKSQLKTLGFEFNNDSDFYSFVSKRLTILTQEQNRNIKELYLDFNTKDQLLIAYIDETVNIDYKDNKITFTTNL
jgi:hypothetical protein